MTRGITLREEKKSLTSQVAVLTEQSESQSGTIQMLEQQIRAAEAGQASLSRQNSQLLVSKNPQAKTQYLDGLRAELNASKKEVIKLQEENKGLKKKDEQAGKRVLNLLNNPIRIFSNNLCKVLETPKVSLNLENSSKQSQEI